MKKLALLVSFLFIIVSSFAQSQRLVMFEEFTNASCPPCAAANPSLNAMLDANAAKVVSVKFQTNWPGTDPMNAYNPTQVATRVTYYGVTGVPSGHLDGNTGFNGQPAGLTQAMVDTRYAVPSPFTIAVSHYLSATNDTIYAHATITCTQATSGTLKAHMAIVERNIYFASAPGTNGEKTFEGVMKQMLPSDQGTALASAWNVGDVYNLDLSWKLTGVYDINQLGVVVWVQNNAASLKDVLQAGYSRPLIPNDAGVTSIGSVNGVQCSTTINPVLNLHNFAINPLTSCNVNYKIDAGSVTTIPWTGNIPTDGNANYSLPTITLTPGGHTLTTYTSSPNGNTDLDTHNDQTVKAIAIFDVPAAAPITQNFLSTTFPPAGWARENVMGDAYQWLRSAAGNNGAGSAKMDFYDEVSGTNNLYPPIFDFSSAVAGATLTFDVAYAQYSTENDRLKVNVSTDCGATWATVYNKAGTTLSTSAAVTTAFTPTTSSQWRNEVINMDTYVGQPDVLVQFQAISAYGNNLYVDNVNITDGTTGVPTLNNIGNISVFPNPSQGNINVSLDFKKAENVTITVTNPLGAVVRTLELKNVSSGNYPFDLTTEAKGNYFINIKTDSGSVTKRVSITQ